MIEYVFQQKKKFSLWRKLLPSPQQLTSCNQMPPPRGPTTFQSSHRFSLPFCVGYHVSYLLWGDLFNVFISNLSGSQWTWRYTTPPPTHTYTRETFYNIWHILGYHVLSRRAPDIDWLMSRDVAEHSLIPRTPSYNKKSWPSMPTLPRLGRTFELSGFML